MVLLGPLCYNKIYLIIRTKYLQYLRIKGGKLRRLLLGVRAGDSNLAKSMYALEMYQHQNSHIACYTYKLSKKSLILADYWSLHVRKMKQSVGNLA